jgi:hypothetical protein
LFSNYNKKDYFIQISKIELDNDMDINNNKKRKTLIKFIPLISKEEFTEKSEWIYIFTIDNKIVKIGGTRTGIKGRVSSYLCGHHIIERGKSGGCSNTNAYIYNTFIFYLKNGFEIAMYGYKLPKIDTKINVFDKEIIITCQTYNAYESIILNDYKKDYIHFPYLSDNCDPEYRN